MVEIENSPMHFCDFQLLIVFWQTPHVVSSARMVAKLWAHSSITRPRVHELPNPPTAGLVLKGRDLVDVHQFHRLIDLPLHDARARWQHSRLDAVDDVGD